MKLKYFEYSHLDLIHGNFSKNHPMYSNDIHRERLELCIPLDILERLNRDN